MNKKFLSIKFFAPFLLLKISSKEKTFIFQKKNKICTLSSNAENRFLGKKYSKKSVEYSFLFLTLHPLETTLQWKIFSRFSLFDRLI
jgi:hypothetical protein